MGIYKLAVGDVVEFEVNFTLNDAGVDKRYGMKLSAQRQALSEQDREFKDQIKVKEFLDARCLQLQSWVDGKSPLVDENKQPVPASKDALDTLYADVFGIVAMVFAAYQVANGAKGRSGNSGG